MPGEPAGKSYEIGQPVRIDPDVILGYEYPGWTQKLIIGEGALIRAGSILYAGSTIGRHFTCGHHALIRAECTIGDRVVVFHKCTLEGRLVIGHGVKIMAHCYLPTTTRIGDLVFIGPGCTFLNHKYPMRVNSPTEGAVVEDGVIIGGGVTVCPGVRIGAGSFIGAGSLVNKDVPPRMLALGSPVRFQPMPENLAGGNVPEMLLADRDLFTGLPNDDSWRHEQWLGKNA